MNDLRFPFRQLRKSAGFSAVAVVTLLGCAWPTLLAARVNPAVALRSE